MDESFKEEIKMKQKVLFISSTGGHLSEMMQLKELFNNYDFSIITEKTKSNMKLQKQYPGRVYYLIYGTKDYMLTYPFKLLANCLKVYITILRFVQNILLQLEHIRQVLCVVLEKYLEVKLFILKHLLIFIRKQSLEN